MLPRGITVPKAFMLFRGGSKEITPADLFNPGIWLNPDGLPASGSIATWTDSSGNGRDVTQVTPANQPIVVTNTLNGFRGASFDGSNDFLRTTNFVPSTGAYSYFVVCRVNNTVNSKAILQNGNDLTGFLYRTAGNNIRVNQHLPSSSMVDGANSNNFEIVSVVRNTTPLATMEVNGTNQVLSPNNSAFVNPTTQLTIGARDTDQFLPGVIVELLIYDKALTAGERLSVTNYLKNKYNL